MGSKIAEALTGPNVRVECPNCGPTIWDVTGQMDRDRLVGYQGKCQQCGQNRTLPPKGVHPAVTRPR